MTGCSPPAGRGTSRGDRPRSLLASLEEQQLVHATARGPPTHLGGERKVRRSAFEEIFSGLDRSGPAITRSPPQARASSAPLDAPYKFGDDIHLLDSARSLKNAMQAERRRRPLLAEEDLRFHETEHLTSSHVSSPIDISHSMILYGEDRITPAKTVALALTELDHHQVSEIPPGGDLFGDPPRQVPLLLHPLHRGRPVPHQHPDEASTRPGAPLPAERPQADLPDHRRQALAITEGGRVYKNPPVRHADREPHPGGGGRLPPAEGVYHHLHAGDRPISPQFVEKLTQINRGRAYFAPPPTSAVHPRGLHPEPDTAGAV